MLKETNKPEKNQNPTKSQNQTFNDPPKTLDKIRPELNLEKWPSIWQPSHSTRGKQKKFRILKKEQIFPDGSKKNLQVFINYHSKLGPLTTEDQKTYFSLIKIWEEKNKPTDYVSFSLRKIARLQNKKWGKNILSEIVNSLGRLAATTFKWESSFYDSTKGETLTSLDWFHILSNLHISFRTKGDKVDKREVGYFRFHDLILKNLLNNYTKPLYFDVVLKFKSEIAQLLYTYIDRIIANRSFNEPFEQRSEFLFKELGLEGKKYTHPSGRKQILEPALKELQGVELSTGILIEARLELTKDKKDYKVIFRKQPKIQEEKTISENKKLIPFPQPNPKAEELVNYFHEKLNRSDHQPTLKELDQATSLLADCSYEQAKYVVDYALEEANKTNFQMRTFGAVFQYKHEALRLYEERKRYQEIIKKHEEQIEKERQEKLQKQTQEKEELKNFYLSLTEDKKQKVKILVQQAIKQKAFPHFFYPQKIDLSSQFYQSFCEMNEDEILKILKQNPDLLDGPPDIQKLISISHKTKPLLEE